MEHMIVERKDRPQPWSAYKERRIRRRWMTPFYALEYLWEWLAFVLSNWAFLEVLEYLGTFSVLVAVIFYFAESGDREKQKHYQAWQVINTAQGKGGSGGRIEALQELNADRVLLVGVDVSGAFLRGIRLERANLLRADLHAADMRECSLSHSNLSDGNLDFANLRGSNLRYVDFSGAVLSNTDLNGADLSYAILNGTDLNNADLRNANLEGIQWRNISNIKAANLYGIRQAPEGFMAWALKKGAISQAEMPAITTESAAK